MPASQASSRLNLMVILLKFITSSWNCFRNRLPKNVGSCSHYAYLEDLYDIICSEAGKSINNTFYRRFHFGRKEQINIIVVSMKKLQVLFICGSIS